MRTSIVKPWGGLLLAMSLVVSAGHARPSLEQTALHGGSALRQEFERGVDELAVDLQMLDAALTSAPLDDARHAFRAARSAYKHQEALLEYYSPSTVSVLNGPAEEEDDETPPRPLGQAAAFQRVEQRLFGRDALADNDRTAAREDTQLMLRLVTHFRTLTTSIDVSNVQMLDAARLELARVSTLWIAGVDSDDSGDAIHESADALEGIRVLVDIALSPSESQAAHQRLKELRSTLVSAVMHLRADADVRTMNRLAFIADDAPAIGRAILDARRLLAPVHTSLRSVWRPTAPTLFAAGAFDVTAYSPDFALTPDSTVVALGERLFNDPRLSGPQTRSCASCHVPRLAFTDGVAQQTAVSGQGRVARNTPTLLNAALQPTLFNDSRALNLEAQVGVVLASPSEMASSADMAARRLDQDSTYRKAFVRSVHVTAVTPTALRAVLAAYVRSLVILDSRFDRAVRGDTLAISAQERRGFTVFMGKGRCGTCHFAPLFSGVMPPTFTTSEPEIIGVPVKFDTLHAVLDYDEGRGGVDGNAEHRHAFKVPTLRNIGRTGPYMHNGAFSTLEQVVDFYNRGGGVGIGVDIPSQTLSSRPLQLTGAERLDLVAFLKSLTDLAPAAQ